MNYKSANLFLSGHCEGSPWPDESPVQKAVQFANQHDELAFLLARQRALDQHALEVLASVTPSPELLKRLQAATESPEQKETWQQQIFQPSLLATMLSILLVCGVGIYFAFIKPKDFAGMAAVQEILETAQSHAGLEKMDTISKSGAEMGDWLFLRYGLEGFTLPNELARAKVVGCRLLKQGGAPIAQMAAEPNLILYVFRAQDLDVKLDQPDWRVVEQEDWVAAIRPAGAICQMISFRGETAAMKRFLQKLARKASPAAP